MTITRRRRQAPPPLFGDRLTTAPAASYSPCVPTIPADSNAPPPEHVDARSGYDRWAEVYDIDGNPLVALEEPEVDKLLGDIRGLSAVDIGCGTGRHALRLALAGANVTAVDFSEGMMAKAHEKPGAERVRFVAHDLHKPWPLPDQNFDRVVSGLVLEHITDLRFFFSELRRICRLDGRVIVSAMHPSMYLRGITARFTDPETGRETRPQSHLHSISDYVSAALGAGLTLEQISEHRVDSDLAARLPRAQKYLGWPLLLMLGLRP